MNEQIQFVSRSQCELCGNTHPTRLLSKPFTDPSVWGFIEQYYGRRVPIQALEGAAYEISQCPVCGFIWQRYILNDSGMQILYDEWILAENSLQKKRDGNQEAGYMRQVALIKRFFPHKSAADIGVLDFGMGWGYWCMAAQRIGYQVTGIELADTRLAFARQQNITAVKNFDELGDRTFDFINAEQVFEHIPNPLNTLKLMVARLSHGGIVRIAVPDGRRIAKEVQEPEWKASKNAIHPLEHINCFTHTTLGYLGKSAGLSVAAEPVIWSLAGGGKMVLRSLAASSYRRFSGTILYFQKR